MKVQIEKIVTHTDPRGTVWEPIGGEELAPQRNCHLVTTLPGGIRGNHYHKIGTEVATQTGPALVRYRDETGTQSVVIAEGEVVRFTFPPGCPHAMRNTGLTPNLLAGFNTCPHDRENPDVYPEILIEARE